MTNNPENENTARLAVEFHTRCHDCGKFVSKEHWVPKNHAWKKHALCFDCYSGYEIPDQY